MNNKLNSKEAADDSDAHKIALELLKQLITLSSGVLALSATFIEKFRPELWMQIAILLISWVCLASSILTGLQAISAIVKSRLSSDDNWCEGIGKKYASASKYLFLAGIVIFAIFAFISFLYSNPL